MVVVKADSCTGAPLKCSHATATENFSRQHLTRKTVVSCHAGMMTKRTRGRGLKRAICVRRGIAPGASSCQLWSPFGDFTEGISSQASVMEAAQMMVHEQELLALNLPYNNRKPTL